MSDERGTGHLGPSGWRLLVVAVFVVSLMGTLLARLYTVQVVGAEGYEAAAATNRVREIVTPAVRGLVLDAQGRPLITNRSALVVSVSRTQLIDSPDGGRALLHRLADLLGEPFDDVWGRAQLCGTPGAPKAPTCFNGAPYQPVPVAEDVPAQVALQILERSEDFPGVTACRSASTRPTCSATWGRSPRPSSPRARRPPGTAEPSCNAPTWSDAPVWRRSTTPRCAARRASAEWPSTSAAG